MILHENKISEFQRKYYNHLEFVAHMHSHVELVIMLEGSAKAALDGKEYILEAGDAFIAFPNRVHRYTTIEHERYVIFIFSCDMFAEYRELFKTSLPENPVLIGATRDPAVEFLAERAVSATDDEFGRVALHGYLMALLGELFARMKFIHSDNRDNSTLQTVISYCENNYTRNLQLSDLSKELFLSTFYISRLFNNCMSMSFNDYINNLRVSEAIRLIKKGGLTVTEIGYSSGFNCIRTFNRAFKKITDTTPGKYKENINK